MPSKAVVLTAKCWDQLKGPSTGEETTCGVPHGETFLTNRKEWTTDMCNNMNEPQNNHAE